MASIFISHSSHDKRFVNRLARELRRRGLSVWIDDRQIKVGHKISARIEDGIANSDYFLIVLSRHAVESAWVNEELDSAHFQAIENRRHSLLPVLIDEVQVPSRLRGYKYADFRASFARGMKALLDVFEIEKDYADTLPDATRHELIEKLLKTTDKWGELPPGVIALVKDASELKLLETNLIVTAEKQVLYNTVDAIGRLADYSYDGRVVRAYSSIEPLVQLYATTTDELLQQKIVRALGPIGSKICYDHLVKWLSGAAPRVKAAILTELSTWDRSDAGPAIPWSDELVKLLHEYIGWQYQDCLYFDWEQEESDFRFWVFRCLAEARRRSSVTYIEGFLKTKDWPLSALAEAAAAHWHITKSDKFVPMLRRAKRSRVVCCAGVTLDEIAKWKRSRRLKKPAGTPAKATVSLTGLRPTADSWSSDVGEEDYPGPRAAPVSVGACPL